jgi:hypothetical protein
VLADLVFVAGVVAAAGWVALWAAELSRAPRVRLLPRWAWASLCVLCVPAGALAYLAVGRAWGGDAPRPPRRVTGRRGGARTRSEWPRG